MGNDARISPHGTDEAESDEYFFRRDDLCDGFCIAHAVLEREDDGAGTHQGRQGFLEMGIGCCFPGYDDQVDRADFFRASVYLYVRETDVPMEAADLKSMCFNVVVFRPHDEADVVSGFDEAGAVVTSKGSCSENGYFHN